MFRWPGDVVAGNAKVIRSPAMVNVAQVPPVDDGASGSKQINGTYTARSCCGDHCSVISCPGVNVHGPSGTSWTERIASRSPRPIRIPVPEKLIWIAEDGASGGLSSRSAGH